jgi:FKBP-type peptidyl-prolyl cis-trans isomerase
MEEETPSQIADREAAERLKKFFRWNPGSRSKVWPLLLIVAGVLVGFSWIFTGPLVILFGPILVALGALMVVIGIILFILSFTSIDRNLLYVILVIELIGFVLGLSLSGFSTSISDPILLGVVTLFSFFAPIIATLFIFKKNLLAENPKTFSFRIGLILLILRFLGFLIPMVPGGIFQLSWQITPFKIVSELLYIGFTYFTVKIFLLIFATDPVDQEAISIYGWKKNRKKVALLLLVFILAYLPLTYYQQKEVSALAQNSSAASGTAASQPSEATIRTTTSIQQVQSSSQTTTDGLIIKDEVIGTGTVAAYGDKVTMNDTGTLDNGTVFNTSMGPGGMPTTFTLDGSVMQKWPQGILGMKVGGTREITVPPALGYGAQGVGSLVPPNSTLHFIITLLSVSTSSGN